VGDQSVERREPGRGLGASVRRAIPTQRADDLVDLVGRLPGQVLDRLQSAERAFGVLVVPQPRCAGAHRDHADRVAGGVVEVPGDPRPLFGCGEHALALGLAFGTQSALFELGDVGAA
jgi:hypothetical protein